MAPSITSHTRHTGTARRENLRLPREPMTAGPPRCGRPRPRPVPSRPCRTAQIRRSTTGSTARNPAGPPRRDADEPEPTRVMPRQPRSESGSQSGPPPPGSPTPRRDRSASAAPPAARRRRRPRHPAGSADFPYGKVVLLVLIAWLAYLVVVPILAWKRIDQVDAIAVGRPAGGATRHDVPPRRLRQPQGPVEGGEPQARHRRRRGRRPAHRHDHAAAHRQRAEPAAVDPARLDRADPGPRHHQDQRRVRLRRRAAAGEDHRAEHRRADRPLRRDRVRRIRELRRRRRRHADLPDEEDGRPAREPEHQEGLPARRRHHRPRLRAVAAHLGHRRHRPGQAPAGGGQRDRRRGEVAVDGAQPGALLADQHGRHVVARRSTRTPGCSTWRGSPGR